MIDRFLRRLSANSRILGGFFVLVLLLALTIPLIMANHSFIVGRLQHVTNIETRADRLLLLASARVMGSRLNLLRYLQDYLPSTWISIKDANQATSLLTEAWNLSTLPDQKMAVASVLKLLTDFKTLIGNVQSARQKGKSEEATRLVFLASKTGYDIEQRIEQIVKDSEAYVTMTNKAVYAETRRRLIFIVAGYAGILILSLIMASLVARSITGPVSEMRRGAEAYRLGHLDTVIPVIGTDELSLLARTFNQMAEQLRESFTALEQREQALAEERNLLRTMIDNLPDYIYVKDTESRYILANSAVIRSLNANSLKEIVGKTDFELFPREIAEQFHTGGRKVLESGEPLINREEPTKDMKTGAMNWRLTTNVPLRDSQENVVGLVGLSRDITEQKLAAEELKKHRDHLEELVKERTDEITTANNQLQQEVAERKRAEEGLRESEKRYRMLFEKAADAIFMLEAEGPEEGKIVAANQAAAEMHGYRIDELLDLNIKDLATPDVAKEASSRIKRILEGEWVNTEISHRRRDGTIFPLEMSAGLLELGNRKYILALDRNIEERKKAEEEKKRLEAQLQHAQRMESIGTLAGGIAHNFNNLLMGIMGNTSLMLLDADPAHPDYKKLITIEKMVESGSKLTSQLLGYARKGRYEIKPISLNQLIKDTSDTFATTRKEIRVHHELAKDLPGIKADQGQIEQALLNLYVNAADAMPKGGDLFLRTMNITDKDMTGKPYEPKPGNYVLLTVRDTGIGMDKKTMERLFDPFFTTKGLAKGTGLGTASVYGIIKGHGGYIDVDSEKGYGATFSIYLPATEKGIKDEKELSSTLLKGKETILLVDDEDMVIDVGEQMLKKLGYKVLLAKGGREALDLYRKNQHKINMVLLDMVMPDMGGEETYELLKEINPNVKVLLSSGYSINGQATEILKRGCDGFIQKPFSMNDLSQKLREILDKGGENER